MSLTARFLGAGLGLACLPLLSFGQFYQPPSTDIGSSTRSVNAANPSQIRIDQRLNFVLSPDITLTNSLGKTEKSAEIFKDRPTVLLLIFYECTGVCSVELRNLQKTLKGIKKEDAGDLYNLVVVSIDPKENATIAEMRRQEFIKAYKRDGTDDGFKFYTGTAENVDKLADEVGFRFYRDPANGQITHPAGIMVVSPERRVCRYFLDQEFQARPLLDAIKDATVDKVGARDDRPFYLACVNIDPLTGQRSLNIMNIVKTGGILTVLGLIVSIAWMTTSNKKTAMKKLDGVEK